mmetsp:Transcript_15306/g.33067  ORF Transcript_15306/g.33067 Transcript_15306/m.33067 type:complete len:125 (-) Transcript_15306:246-620(-)|eukprot:CAMPEP_0206470862 /NCGR_PEP_ID=MMETSP0324_2-20121206/31198_1 /ASSEMBLY_ACC=CAM_ASM_000836 /TAXON_ID=2866 /ORGANISM="Crypthecodinium cohnii, Strain Seligo" /LENGTH=124 /DNA_ID=CAMNT_0053945033 /DNA_START=174 /DNA_END=548 /DNA_ORIENTATION=-
MLSWLRHSSSAEPQRYGRSDDDEEEKLAVDGVRVKKVSHLPCGCWKLAGCGLSVLILVALTWFLTLLLVEGTEAAVQHVSELWRGFASNFAHGLSSTAGFGGSHHKAYHGFLSRHHSVGQKLYG